MMARPAWSAAGVTALAVLSGCATAHRPDPMEPFNRKVFAVNEVVDGAVLKPAALAYTKAIPQGVRTSIGHFFANPLDLWSSVNLLLQGRPAGALSDAARFGANSTIGVFGLFDVASRAGLEPYRQDLGSTLARWGVGNGAYLVLPLLGPTTLRDATNLPAEFAFGASFFGGGSRVRNTLTALSLTDTRASMLPATDMLDSIALDRYVFVRDAYLQRRGAEALTGN